MEASDEQIFLLFLQGKKTKVFTTSLHFLRLNYSICWCVLVLLFFASVQNKSREGPSCPMIRICAQLYCCEEPAARYSVQYL